MPRACPNGHPVDDERARLCSVCGSMLVPQEAADAAAARARGETAPVRDPGRISPRMMGLGLLLVAILVGIIAAIIMLNSTTPIGGPAI